LSHTWDVTDLPSGRKAIGCKWVFKRKKDAEGNVARYKARLCAKVFSQVHGIDYNETFSPVAKLQAIRTVLALAAKLDLELQQMDVRTAYLNSGLKETIFMGLPKLPHTMKNVPKGKVALLRKGLYGLKQAGRNWNTKINKFLTDFGFRRCKSDPCIYRLNRGKSIVFLVLYVDDLILAHNDKKLVTELKSKLGAEYDMKDLGDLCWCLGMQVTRHRPTRTLTIDQSSFAEAILKTFRMDECSPVTTPIVTGSKLTSDAQTDDSDLEKKYRQAVGSLMYLMLGTRPDLAFSVCTLSRFMAKPTAQHWVAMKRVLRYIRGTAELGIVFSGEKESRNLFGYCDSDWGGDTDTRKSTTGYIFFFVGPISWNTKRQPTVALSTTEAEYMAACTAAKQAIWLQQLFGELGFPQGTTNIFQDNRGCIQLANNPVFHKRTKHIDIRYHFIRELITDMRINLPWISTKDMVADFLTKPLARDLFEYFRKLAMCH
jgi:hypothetical protein